MRPKNCEQDFCRNQAGRFADGIIDAQTRIEDAMRSPMSCSAYVEVQSKLHLFNNQVCRITLLADALTRDTEDRFIDGETARIAEQIQAAALDAASYGAAIVGLIMESARVGTEANS